MWMAGIHSHPSEDLVRMWWQSLRKGTVPRGHTIVPTAFPPHPTGPRPPREKKAPGTPFIMVPRDLPLSVWSPVLGELPQKGGPTSFHINLS